MQILQISSSTKIRELISMLGRSTTESVLNYNDIGWTANVGSAFDKKCKDTILQTKPIDHQRKATILNGLVDDLDIFEKASLSSEDDWKIISKLGTFANYLKIPDGIKLPDSDRTMGNNVKVPSRIYEAVMQQLSSYPYQIDPAIFNEYSNVKPTELNYVTKQSSTSYFAGRMLPAGTITITSSISGETVDMPCYPEEISDSRKANYTTMPDILYQYEPWQLYESSGPRSNTYTFKMHRDMISGDHSDGVVNDIIRFLESNCFPEYSGSVVNTPICSMYIHGVQHIRGVITSVECNWSGPILRDGWYGAVDVQVAFTEVSDTPLSYSVVRQKGVIG